MATALFGNVCDENIYLRTRFASVFPEQKVPRQQREALRNISCKPNNISIQQELKGKAVAENGQNFKHVGGNGWLINDCKASFQPFKIHEDEDVPLPTKEEEEPIVTEPTEVTDDFDRDVELYLTECLTELTTEDTYESILEKEDAWIDLNSDAITLESFVEEVDVTSEIEVTTDDAAAKKILLLPPKESDWQTESLYSEDTYLYLRELELKNKPDPKYLEQHREIPEELRTALISWMIETVESYNMYQETLYLAVNYVDRFLSQMKVVPEKLQLLATGAMFVASKMEEVSPPDMNTFVEMAYQQYRKDQVLRLEKMILTVLKFELNVPTPLCFVLRFARIGGLDLTTKLLAMYIAELSLLKTEPFLSLDASKVAAAAVYLANITLGKEAWKLNFLYMFRAIRWFLRPDMNGTISTSACSMCMKLTRKPLRKKIT